VSNDLFARGRELHLRAEACVIGTGAGGAVAAAELARAGLDVVVLEQGGHWTSRDFTQREEEMLPRLFEEAGMRQTEDGSVVVLQGRNVGGSTVHNLCYAFQTPEPILGLWREEHGLAGMTPEALAPSFARVEHALSVTNIRDDEINSLNRVMRAGTEALGWSGFVARHNRRGCIGAGYCILGCSYDAKQSMLVTYVPEAEKLGARLFARARAERIEARGEGGTLRAARVVGHAVDDGGREGASFSVEAPIIVLAAGAVASPDLLLRSGLANGSGQVGASLHLHPSVMAAGIFEEELHPYRGIPQSWYVDEFIDLERNPHTGHVLMPITGFPVLTAANLPGFGADHFRYMQAFSRTAGVLALLHDRSEGSVRPGASPAKPRIHYALTPEDAAELAAGLRHCAEVLFAGGAREVVVPWTRGAAVFRPGDDLREIERRGVSQSGPSQILLASTHPQSTCRMGADPRTSVVGGYGESHEVRGLFVADMSVFPTSLGAPPQITTAALADRTARYVIERRAELLAGA
jgi:choline dehydrogenase-like flavoprotein